MNMIKLHNILRIYIQRGGLFLFFTFIMSVYGCQQGKTEVKKPDSARSAQVGSSGKMMKPVKGPSLPQVVCCKGYPSRARALAIKK